MAETEKAAPSAPHRTLYIQNLNDRIKLKDLRTLLCEKFSPFGQIDALICKRRVSLRGQAFLTFHTRDQALLAERTMQNKPLYGRPMVIHFARFKAHCEAKEDGSLDRVKEAQAKAKLEKANEPKVARRDRLQALADLPHTVALQMAPLAHGEMPNKILFVQHIQQSIHDLQKLFGSLRGFIEIRRVPAKPDIAFVEFEDEALASHAKVAVMNAIKGLHSGESQPLKVTFAKR